MSPPGMQRDTSIEVKLVGKPGDGRLQVNCDAPGMQFAVSEKNDMVTITVSNNTPMGLHWIRFYNQYGASRPLPFFVGSLPETNEVEPNDQLSQANRLPNAIAADHDAAAKDGAATDDKDDAATAPAPVTKPAETAIKDDAASEGTAVNSTEVNDDASRQVLSQQRQDQSAVLNGVLEKAGDVDCCSLSLSAGQTLVAALEAHRILQSPMDGVLQLLDEAGTVVAQNDDACEIDPMIVYHVPADATYFLRIFAFPSAANSTIRYAGGADYVYRLTVTTRPRVDHVMPMAVASGERAAVTSFGWNLDADTASLVIPASGDEFAFAGTQTIDSPILVDVVNSAVTVADASGRTKTSVPGCVSGYITDDVPESVVVFDGTRNQKLRFQVIARARQSMLDPVLVIRSADGRVIKEADDISKENPDCDLSITLPADGEFEAAVRDRFRHSGERYYFTLKVATAAPDFEPTVPATEFSIVADQPLEIPVTVGRRDGFSEAIRFVAVGLPDGVRCEPVTSENTGDSAKSVTVTLQGDTPNGFTGRVRIEGTSVTSNVTHSVRASIPGRIDAVAAVWLTVPASPITPETAADDSSETDPAP